MAQDLCQLGKALRSGNPLEAGLSLLEYLGAGMTELGPLDTDWYLQDF